MYRELGRLDDAKAAVDASLVLKPDSCVAHCVLAEIAFTRRDFDAAHRALDDAERLDGNHPKVFELRGRTYFVQGRHEDGIAAMRRSIELAPDFIPSRFLVAVMLKETGQFQEAIAVTDEVIRRDPGHARARALRESIRKAMDGT